MPANSYRLLIILHDLSMVALAWALAIIIRYDLPLEAEIAGIFWQVLPIVVGLQGLVLWHSGLYKGIWRFASLHDLAMILQAALLGTLAIVLILVLFNRLEGIPRSSLLFYPFLLIFLLGMPRLLYRLAHEKAFLLSNEHNQRVLVLGAGSSGDMLVRDMLRSPDCGYIPVAFLDDQLRLHGGKVQGVPVVGDITQVCAVAEQLQVDLIIIAMPSASDQQMQRVVEFTEQCNIPVRTLPKLDHMVNEQAHLSALREVSIDDLLGREKVELDWQAIEAGLAGKTVLVSGGGGSIGSELCWQIAELKPTALVILERSEFNLYQVELQLREDFPDLPLYACLGDILDRVAVTHVFDQYQPDIVFHAAAYKHVPMLQFQAREAARNNILGTQILAEVTVAQGCQSFVLISTDKAVNPSNIMGCTKRAAEMLCQGLNAHSNTHFITVRFGNVLGSAGSVVPLFQRQIAKGGPVTVTHPDISRYFMTIPEACQLILQAGAMGNGGEVFVLDMGTPVQIRYLAEQMIRLSGKVPGQDIEIVYTGLRPGEKLHEELFHGEEQFCSTTHRKIFLAAPSYRDWDKIQHCLARLQRACDCYAEAEIKAILDEMMQGL